MDVLLINKIDAMDYFDFDMKACEERVKKLNPNITIIVLGGAAALLVGEELQTDHHHNKGPSFL